MRHLDPDTKPKAIMNWVCHVWPFAHEMKKGDLVVLPFKTQPAIQIGEIMPAPTVSSRDMSSGQVYRRMRRRVRPGAPRLGRAVRRSRSR